MTSRPTTREEPADDGRVQEELHTSIGEFESFFSFKFPVDEVNSVKIETLSLANVTWYPEVRWWVVKVNLATEAAKKQ